MIVLILFSETTKSHPSDGREHQRSIDVFPLGDQEHGAKSAAIMVGIVGAESYQPITRRVFLCSLCIWIQG